MAKTRKPKATLVGLRSMMPLVYPEAVLKAIGERVDWIGSPALFADPEPGEEFPEAAVDPEAEIIFSTWGMVNLDEAFLEDHPNLKAVFYGAGTVRGFVGEASWKHGIRIFSAALANAVPVAEFTVAQILLGLKQSASLRIREAAQWRASHPVKMAMRGNYRARVGLVSYGAIARLVRRNLRLFDHEVWVYDPFLTREEADEEDIRLVSLEDLFRECLVVSLHAPLLEATRHLVRGHHLESMPANACFINTARGAIVHEAEMAETLRNRTDLTAIIDVLEKEPPEDGNPLLQLSNAWVYPHIAGSMGQECGRMGEYMLNACDDYLAGRASTLEVVKADMGRIA